MDQSYPQADFDLMYDTIKTVAIKYTCNNTHTFLEKKKNLASFERQIIFHRKKGYLFWQG
jgi:hypothetical protein